MKKFDERDTMFARKALRPNSNAYRDYYERHPEKKRSTIIFANFPKN
jgi:hypothetical protein